MLITAMGQSVVNTNQQIGHMAQVIGNNTNSGSDSHGYRALKPKKDMTRLSGENARVFMDELDQFEVDLNELGLSTFSEAAYRQLRAMVEGKARDVVNIETVHGNGKLL